MKVTGVFLRKLDKGKIYAKADIMFDNVLSVKGFTIFKNKEGGFNVLPPATLGKGKDKESGEIVDKWWDNIYIKRDTDEGQALLSEINEKVVLKIRKEDHAEAESNSVLDKAEEDLLSDDDAIF